MNDLGYISYRTTASDAAVSEIRVPGVLLLSFFLHTTLSHGERLARYSEAAQNNSELPRSPTPYLGLFIGVRARGNENASPMIS